jgi:hypothetical protein
VKFVLEFDYRSDDGSRHVGPFMSRAEAFSWAERTINGGEASYHAYPLTDPYPA